MENKEWNELENCINVDEMVEISEKIRRRRYEQKLDKNDQYAMQSRENESRFHYLCIKVTNVLQSRYLTPTILFTSERVCVGGGGQFRLI